MQETSSHLLAMEPNFFPNNHRTGGGWLHCDKVMRPTNYRTVLWDLWVERGLEKMWWPLWPETKGDSLIPDEACDRMSCPSIQTSLKKCQLSSRA